MAAICCRQHPLLHPDTTALAAAVLPHGLDRQQKCAYAVSDRQDILTERAETVDTQCGKWARASRRSNYWVWQP